MKKIMNLPVPGTPFEMPLETVVEMLKAALENATGYEFDHIRLKDDDTLAFHDYDCYGWGDQMEETPSDYSKCRPHINVYQAIKLLQDALIQSEND